MHACVQITCFEEMYWGMDLNVAYMRDEGRNAAASLQPDFGRDRDVNLLSSTINTFVSSHEISTANNIEANMNSGYAEPNAVMVYVNVDAIDQNSGDNGNSGMIAAAMCMFLFLSAMVIQFQAVISYTAQPSLCTINKTNVVYGISLSLTTTGMCMCIFVAKKCRQTMASVPSPDSSYITRVLLNYLYSNATSWSQIRDEFVLSCTLSAIAYYNANVWNMLTSTTSIDISIFHSCIVWIIILWPMCMLAIPTFNAISCMIVSWLFRMIAHEMIWHNAVRRSSPTSTSHPDTGATSDSKQGRRNELECCICHETLDDLALRRTSTVETVLCKHKFHGACLRQWVQYNPSCPTCRTSFC
jgi:hypothetical protein